MEDNTIISTKSSESQPLSIDFNNTALSFKHLSNKDLKFAHFIFSLMRSEKLVNFLTKSAMLSVKIGLPVAWIVKPTIFRQFCGGENFKEAKKVVDKLYKHNVQSILDYGVEAAQDEVEFEKTKEELLRNIRFAANEKSVPVACLKVTGLGKFALLEKMSANETMSEAEKDEYLRVINRLNQICEAAYQHKVGLYIDAEESWIQPAIDQIAESMMAKYNSERVIVFTTLQMYRHDRLAYFKELIDKSKRGNFLLGVKFVRGAYLEKENNRALSMGYPTPMQPNKETTDKDYDTAINIAVANIDRIAICAGTHNGLSALQFAQLLVDKKIPRNHPHAHFSQLLGMSDNISFSLAQEGFNVTKYVPYGPVKDVLPYLIRRAEENKSVGGQLSKELALIKLEIQRRKT